MSTIENRVFNTGTGTSLTGNLTLSAGNDRRVIVVALLENATVTFSGATYDSDAMTSITTAEQRDSYLEAWYYDVADGKAANDYDVVVSTSGSTNLKILCWQLSECATGDPDAGDWDTATVADYTNADIACTFDAENGEAILTGVCNEYGTRTATAASSEVSLTERYNNSSDAFRAYAHDGAGDASESVTITYTYTDNRAAKVMFAMAVASATGGSSNGAAAYYYAQQQ